MALTEPQKQTIADLDRQAKSILVHGGDEALLMSMYDKMDAIKDIMTSSSEPELNLYCEHYDGFYRTMQLLERLALGISEGNFKDILKRD